MLHLPNEESFFVGEGLVMSKWQAIWMLRACGGVLVKVKVEAPTEQFKI